MRDLLVMTVVFGSLPAVFLRPHLGIVVWTWLSLMNPHRLGWGFAYDFPVAKLVGGVALAGLLICRERKKLPWATESFLLVLLGACMLLTTVVALEPSSAWRHWDKVWKILLLVLLTMALMIDRRRVEMLIWTIVISLGFYGVKGGIFTILSGGAYHVLGPPGSFIGDNNHLGLALVMVLPLMRYLQLTMTRPWIRLGLTVAMLLTVVAIVGTQSRGAFMGLGLTVAFLALKSRRRLALVGACLVVAPAVFVLMPQTWHERIDSIPRFREDPSAMGRVNAWHFAVNVAVDRPLVGGGFGVFSPQLFQHYAPDPDDFHDAHSIYFEILGEHGFVALFLFLALGVSTWFSCRRLVRMARGRPDLRWAADLGRMCQVSLVAYASTGAFVGLAYFDLYYNVVSVVVITKMLVADARRLEGVTVSGGEMPRPVWEEVSALR